MRRSDAIAYPRTGALTAVLAVVAVVLGLAYAAPRAVASSVTSAAFTGGAGTLVVGSTLYAKNGGVLTLTVVASNDTQCVDVTGAFSAHQQVDIAKSTWTFSFVAGLGTGAQTVTATAFPKFNNNDVCTGQNQSPKTASFTLDNSGPVVTGALAPAPNGAGWNNSDVTVAWSATDAGSGVGSGPTPGSATRTANGIVALNATAADRLGNSSTGSVTVRLDKTGPSITGSRTPSGNGFGWNNSPVTVNFSCVDLPASD